MVVDVVTQPEYTELTLETRRYHWKLELQMIINRLLASCFVLFFFSKKKVKVLLNEKLLKEEITHLESTRLLRDRLTAAENWDGNDDDFVGKRRDSESDLYFKSDRLRLLFKWCKMVCRIYGLKVRN